MNTSPHSTESASGCQCVGPGFCLRHLRPKDWTLFRLCQQDKAAFDQWERARREIDIPAEVAQGCAEQGIPSLFQRVLHLATASVQYVIAGRPQVEDVIYEQRLTTCRSCDQCDVDRMVCRHRECGCSLPIKARWATERCPLDRWTPTAPGSRPKN